MLVIDVETTGLSPEKNDIIQFSAVKVDNNLEIIDELDMYIKCAYSVPPEIVKINGITNNLLKEKGLEPDEAVKKIISFCKNEKEVMGYSVDFDLNFLKGFLQKNGREIGEISFSEKIDTLKLAREKVEGSHKLSVLAEKAGFKGTNFHNSMEDVLATLCVYKWLCEL